MICIELDGLPYMFRTVLNDLLIFVLVYHVFYIFIICYYFPAACNLQLDPAQPATMQPCSVATCSLQTQFATWQHKDHHMSAALLQHRRRGNTGSVAAPVLSPRDVLENRSAAEHGTTTGCK